MTPRSLLTAIGATAVAFAIAIGVAAGGTSGMMSEENTGVVAVVADEQRALPLLYLTKASGPAAGERLVVAVWNDPCVTAM